MGKTVAILANLDPSGYADMTAIAASQVAMAAVAASAYGYARRYAPDAIVAYSYLRAVNGNFRRTFHASTARSWLVYTSIGKAMYCAAMMVLFLQQWHLWLFGPALDGTASRQYTGTQRYNSSMGSNTYNDQC